MSIQRLVRYVTLMSIVFAIGGCATNSPAPATTPAPASFTEQVAQGQTLYAQNCASCHGDAGQGAKASRVAGLKEDALPLDPPADRKLRKGQFGTVAAVAQFAVANMPPKKLAPKKLAR
jgi:mono/diheme cytochrome c family protein